METLIKKISQFLFGDADFFRFQYPIAFVFLLGIVFLVFYQYWSKSKQKSNSLFDQSTVFNTENFKFLLPNYLKNRYLLKNGIWFTAFVFLIIGLANVQFGTKKEEVQQVGVDVVFALDVSKSMLAEDFKPNRLDRAKNAIGKIVDELGSDRIAIVVFAGDAYLQLPLTNDHAAAKMYLESIDTDIIPLQGTSVSSALKKAIAAFPNQKKENNGKQQGKSIILISDGEDHEEDALKLAEECAEDGIALYTLGIGTPSGSTIPELVNGRKVGLKKDRNGSTIVTKINEELLIELAEKGKGKYVSGSNQDIGLDYLFNEIKSMDKNEYGAKKFTLYEDRFPIFLFIAFLLISLELFIFNHQLFYKKQ